MISCDCTVLVLDGHDGAGKTTLARRLADTLGGAYARPFAGEVGQNFLESAEQGNLALAAALARNAVNDSLKKCVAPILVFDRHWMTAFSVLPESYRDAWKPLPPTVLCWADLETTLARLRYRATTEEDAYDHRHFLSTYWALAERYGCKIVRTDHLSFDESFAVILSWARSLLKRG